MQSKSKNVTARVIVWLVANERIVTAAVVVLLALALVGAVEGAKP